MDGEAISKTLSALHKKYLLADGLMVCKENKGILKDVLAEINYLYEILVAESVNLPHEINLPGTTTKIIDVKTAKSEFDARVKDWQESIELAQIVNYDEKTPSSDVYEVRSVHSKRSGRSSSSSVIYRRKEGLVKLKKAMFAKEREAEKCRIFEENQKELDELEERLKFAEREENDRLERIRRDGEDRLEALRRKASRIRETRKRELEEQERAWDAEGAKVEADAWEEVFSDKGSERLSYVERDEVKPSKVFEKDLNGESKGSLVQKRHLTDIKTKLPNHASVSLIGNCSGEGFRLSGNRPRYGEVSGRPTYRQFRENSEIVRPLREKARNGESSHQYVSGAGCAPAQSTITHDYPPPKPVIQTFNGDPLSYWPFMRSFDTHIAQRMNSDSAELVYLLQHCSPKIRANLEHFARDSNRGYTLACESLYEDYGQPHIIAHCCEERLLKAPRLRSKDPSDMKALAVLLEKSLAMLEDIQDFATLNSLGTIRKITEKFTEEMQKDWVRFSFRIFKQTGKQARFPELVEFMQGEAEEANSLYGKVLYGASKRSAGGAKQMVVFGTGTETPSALPSGSKRTASCPFCRKPHVLAECKEFQKLKRFKRISFLISERRCFRCLVRGHVIGECKSVEGCAVAGCADPRHHTLLHKESETGSAAEEIVCSAMEESYSKRPYFMTVPVRVSCCGRESLTYAMLDTGSQRTFCSASLAKRLQAKGPIRPVPMCTLSTGQTAEITDCMVIPLTVQGVGEKQSIDLREVLTVPSIPLKAASIPSGEELRHMKHLRGVKLSELKNKKVELLVGLDASFVFRPLESIYGPRGTPDAVKTVLGWTLFGPAPSVLRPNSKGVYSMHVACVDEDEVCSAFEDKFVDTLAVPNSREDRIAFGIMKDSIELVDGHFRLPLLWRRRDSKLPGNYSLAVSRAESLRRRLNKDERLRKKYSEVMQGYIEKGYAELVPKDFRKENSREWFLPHFPVLNPKKPDKLRIVFDCAARHMGTSLNDALLQGPDLVNCLTGVLTRFREEKIALVADIEAMFHQVKVRSEDMDSLKFLWWRDGDTSLEPEIYRMTVHLFGAVSSPSCATFALRQTADLFGQGCSSSAVNAIRHGFYVDDCLVSVATENEAIETVADMRRILSCGGFNLTKWLSNNESVMSTVPEEHRAKVAKELPFGDDTGSKVLGVYWEVSSDMFRMKVNIPDKPYTRRGILSMVHSLFDPLGFVAPVLLEPKLLLRHLNDREWDETVSEEEITRWKAWLMSLEKLEGLAIPRCLKPPDVKGELKYELHHFADASQLAYGAVSYLRVVDAEGHASCSLLMGKSHLAPKPSTTIPRLELQAAVTALRLDKAIKKELSMPIDETYFWSDSTAVLLSIYNSKKRFPVFVANRLAEIERYSNPKSWRYVPSELNPADEVSRGISAQRLITSSTWIHGPKFLHGPSTEWPEQLRNLPALPEDFPLFERKVEPVATLFSSAETADLPADRLIKHYSSLYRLKRAVVWWRKYMEYLKIKVKKNGMLNKLTSKVDVLEMRCAENALVRYVQKGHFVKLVEVLEKGTKLTNKVCPWTIRKLDPLVSDGVLRVGGRLSKAPLDFDARHPIILPADSWFTRLIIAHYHELVGHSGINHTFAALREKFWVLKGGAAVRSVLAGCWICRRRNSLPGVQKMADLPEARMQMHQPVFFHTGVDCFGPFMVKQGRSVVKRSGCIFTCMVSRAVHLEVLHSLTSDSFISALRRFVGRRGGVGHVYSDNGTNFVGGQRVLK